MSHDQVHNLQKVIKESDMQFCDIQTYYTSKFRALYDMNMWTGTAAD